ncbi:hypothetical protein FLJC2902T_17530 [Flavobacterium limnosediminis JC2902]|uniref:Carboxypeptidase regulatory-like domain-containing protein n=1 Tax=Flavobacterium limnosediminis JC2902 TaxID=1341181 RepID=V6SVD8_9FLAO|nr:hypothetical protein [Flavobacterium limnosediminis]ESU28395.1 hypothetical protein FLJC2902T_17530 [Flavobacterium limnosediminis JC2902]
MKIVIGTIFSTLAGEPLPGATIQEIGGTAKAITDSKGNFSMGVASELSYLKISAPEHKDKTVQAVIFDIRKSEDLDPVTGTTLDNLFIKKETVNWLGVVTVTAILAAGVTTLYANSQKKASVTKTVKAKI